jgi:hypothetical protein
MRKELKKAYEEMERLYGAMKRADDDIIDSAS